MFTGIIQCLGRVAARDLRGGDLQLALAGGELDSSSLELGESIAVNGVCLTVVAITEAGFRADVSAETLSRTLLGEVALGQAVNLERALQPTTRLGGHLVSGHVDGVGEVVGRRGVARSVRFTFRAPGELARFIAEKGSICVDGTSLTVNAVRGAEFDINCVPHTLAHTIMGDYQPGSRVHLEVDLIARYLERLLLGERAAEPIATGLDAERLFAWGYRGGAGG